MSKHTIVRRFCPSAMTIAAMVLAAPSAFADGAVSKLGRMGMSAGPGEAPQFDAMVVQYNQSGEWFFHTFSGRDIISRFGYPAC